MHIHIFTWCRLERFVSFFVFVHISAMSQLYGYGKSEMSQMLRQRKSKIILLKFLMLLGILSGKVTLPFLFCLPSR